jgi:hypothetical protein
MMRFILVVVTHQLIRRQNYVIHTVNLRSIGSLLMSLSVVKPNPIDDIYCIDRYTTKYIFK